MGSSNEAPPPLMAHHPQPGDVINERYELIRLLGAGGMGNVFLARDLLREEARDPRPFVAIKFLIPDLLRDAEALRIVQLEATRTQRLRHPNIVAVYTFERFEGLLYIVMEYVEGQPLTALIAAHPEGIPFRTASRIISAIAAALSYAHRNSVVHLDLKPANVFVETDGTVKVLDFGLARAIGAVGEGILHGAGSPLYASPEVMAGIEADPRDDVFSFSITVHELLTGVHPFGASPATEKSEFPKRSAQLSWPQWRALRRGASYRREDRAASIEAVARPFETRQHSPRSFTTLGRAAIGLLAGALKFIPTIDWRLRPRAVPDEQKKGRGEDDAHLGSWVADQPISTPLEDAFEYVDYAKALFGVIDHPNTKPPLTIAINGPFGIGKSSVALLTQHLLQAKPEDRGEKAHVTAWIHVGKYRGAPSFRGALIKDLVRQLHSRQDWWSRTRHVLPKQFLLRRERRYRRVLQILLLGALSFTSYLAARRFELGNFERVSDYSSVVGALATFTLAAAAALKSSIGPFKSLADYVDADDERNDASQHEEARQQLARIIYEITGDRRRFVLFIDDLERSPERTLEVLDIIEGLFRTSSCVVVLSTDLDLLADALQRHSNVRGGRRYLEKYIQLQFDMPSVENSRLVSLLTRFHGDLGQRQPKSSGDTIVGAHTIAGARERIDSLIRREGLTGPIANSELVVNATRWNLLVDERKQRALLESDIYRLALQVAISVAGRDIRAAKRISNHVRLYLFVLFHRGLLASASAVTAEHVGRWVALKELWPEVFDVINRTPDLFSALSAWADVETADTLDAINEAAADVRSPHVAELVDAVAALSATRRASFRIALKAEPRLDTVIRQLSFLR